MSRDHQLPFSKFPVMLADINTSSSRAVGFDTSMAQFRCYLWIFCMANDQSDSKR